MSCQADSRLPTPQIPLPAEIKREHQRITNSILEEIHKQFPVRFLESILALLVILGLRQATVPRLHRSARTSPRSWTVTSPSLIALAGGLSFLLLTACGTVQEHRARHFSSVFQSLPPSTQELLLSGRVEPGMSSDAVYIAWGRPKFGYLVGNPDEADSFDFAWVYWGQRSMDGLFRPSTELDLGLGRDSRAVAYLLFIDRCLVETSLTELTEAHLTQPAYHRGPVPGLDDRRSNPRSIRPGTPFPSLTGL